MKVAISGASGLVGAALARSLAVSGHTPVRLVRPKSKSAAQAGNAAPLSADAEIEWDPLHGVREPSQLEGIDAIVHLAGRSIAAQRWTDAEKQRIRESRVDATRRLVDQITKLERKPPVFVSASAIGIYGDSGSTAVDEDSPVADDFLAEVALSWESASRPLADCGVRVAYARLGIVLSTEGGALAKVVPLFRWMLGGKLGSGSQIWSWIALEDCVRAIRWMLDTDSATGPYNVVSPQPVTNQRFTQLLSEALHRPAWLPAPKFGLRLALGEMADALLLSSCRVVPKRLQAAGFPFHYPDLQSFLQTELSAPPLR